MYNIIAFPATRVTRIENPLGLTEEERQWINNYHQDVYSSRSSRSMRS